MARGNASGFRAFFFIALVVLGPHASLARQTQSQPAATGLGPAPAPAVVARYEGGEVDGGMSSTSSSRIQSVVDTMKGILSSIQETERTEAGNYKCFMEWCASEIETTNTSLQGSQDDFESETVSSEETSAQITNTEHEISEASDEIVEVQDTLAQTTNIRDKDRQEYTEDSTMNTQSLNQINTAIQMIGQVHNQGGFLQKGVLKRIQLNEPGESKFVLGVMKGIKQKLEKTKGEQDSSETEKEDQYNNLTSVKTAQLQSLQSDVAEKKTLSSEHKISLVESKNDAQDAKREITALQLHLDETREECTKKTREWQTRSADRQSEKAAISEAIAYMEQTAQEDAPAPVASSASLIVASTAVDTTAASDDAAPAADEADEDAADESDTDDDAGDAFLQVSHRLRRVAAHARASRGLSMASTLAMTADAQLSALSAQAPSQRKEGFGGAIKIVKDLLVVLQDQQKEENQKRKYCKAEIETKDTEKTETQEKLDMLNATINRKDTMIQTYADEVAQMERENAAAKSATDEAKVLRDGEKSAYEAGAKDRTLAVKVIRQAKTVLAAFYESKEKGSLAQVTGVHDKSGAPPPETWSSTSSQRQSTGSGAVMMMLDKIAEDIETEQKDAAIEEKTSAKAYDRFQKDSRDEFDKRAEEMTDRVTRKAKALVQVNNHREESTSLQEDFDSITVQLGDLHSECDALLQNHKQREEARFHEISQLRDVIDILSGSSVAARTGDSAAAAAALVQKPQMSGKPQRQQQPRVDAGNDDQLSELQDLSSSIDGLAAKARSLAQS